MCVVLIHNCSIPQNSLLMLSSSMSKIHSCYFFAPTYLVYIRSSLKETQFDWFHKVYMLSALHQQSKLWFCLRCYIRGIGRKRCKTSLQMLFITLRTYRCLTVHGILYLLLKLIIWIVFSFLFFSFVFFLSFFSPAFSSRN